MKRIKQIIKKAAKQGKTAILTPDEWQQLIRFGLRQEGWAR